MCAQAREYSPYVTSVAFHNHSVSFVAVGSRFQCGIANDGSVSCLGYGGDGAIGDGSYADTDGLDARNVNTVTSASHLDAGSDYVCAIDSTEGVLCWGNNTYGTLGETGILPKSNVPVPVALAPASGATPVKISSGATHACVLLSNGTVQCWGNNSHGTLGRNTDGDTALAADYVLDTSGVGNLTNVTDIATGDRVSCAVRTDHSIVCWGAGEYGALGSGQTTDGLLPAIVQDQAGGDWPDSGAAASSVVIGSKSVCALRTDGTVACWGAGGYGQIGNGTTTATNVSPMNVSTLTSVTQLASTATSTCALVAGSGTQNIRCWGADISGELGQGTISSGSTTPTAPRGIGYSSDPTALRFSVGNNHSYQPHCDEVRVIALGAEAYAQNSSNLPVELFSTGSTLATAFYSDQNCDDAATSTTIASGSLGSVFYFKTAASSGGDSVTITGTSASQPPSDPVSLNIAVDGLACNQIQSSSYCGSDKCSNTDYGLTGCVWGIDRCSEPYSLQMSSNHTSADTPASRDTCSAAKLSLHSTEFTPTAPTDLAITLVPSNSYGLTVTTYTDSSCDTQSSTATILAGQNDVDFYFKVAGIGGDSILITSNPDRSPPSGPANLSIKLEISCEDLLDPVNCTRANCEWADGTCIEPGQGITCDSFNEEQCNADPTCMWIGICIVAED